MEVYPFIDELMMLREATEADVNSAPDSSDAAEQLKTIQFSIDAARVFSEELSKIPSGDLKPNFMLEGSRSPFGSRGTESAKRPTESADAVAQKLAERQRAKKATQNVAKGSNQLKGSSPKENSTPSETRSSQKPASPTTKPEKAKIRRC